MSGLLWRCWEKLLESRDEICLHEVDQSREQTLSEDLIGKGLAAQHYERAESQVWVWIRLRLSVEHACHYLIVFDRQPRELGAGVAIDQSVVVQAASRAGYVNGTGNDYEVPVLVEVVKLSNGMEETTFVPSVVRLYLLDELQRGGIDTPSYPKGNLFPRPWETVPALAREPIEDWKLGGQGRTYPPVGSNQLPGQMVEGSAQVVDAVSDDRAPFEVEDRRMIGSVYVHDLIRPYFGLESVGARLHQDIEAVIETIQVEPRSLDLDVHAVKRGWLPPPTSLRSTHKVSSDELGNDDLGDAR